MEQLAQLHPVIVHFPIAFLTFYVIVEVVNSFLKKEKIQFLASVLILAGVLTGVGAVLTGNQAEHAVEDILKLENMHDAHEQIEEHESSATILLWYFAILMVVRFLFINKKSLKGINKIIITVLAIGGLYFIFITGNYGGKLVYKYGVGTEILNEINK